MVGRAMNQEERAQLDRTLTRVTDILGADVVGAYLHGSAVLGRLRARSDVDIFVVTKRRLAAAEKRRLVASLLDISRHPRPIELTVAVHDEIRPWRYPPRMDFQYGDWWRAEYERGIVEPYGSNSNPDLAPLIRMVVQGDQTLLGAPASDVFDPVPQEDFVAALAHGAGELAADIELDTRNVVLTFARILCGMETGQVQSKDAAADWVLPRLSPALRPILQRARDAYVSGQDEEWDDLLPAARTYADYMANRIARLAPS
jgi:predicted nucleotidyltransferase